MRSLKGTLFRGVILGTLVVLLLAGTVLYLSVGARLVHQMDESLTDRVRTVAQSIEEKHYGLEVDLAEMRTEEMENAESPEYIYISTLDGNTIYRSDIFKDSAAPTGLPVAPGEVRYDWYIIKGAGKMRSVLFSFQPGVDDEEEDPESVAADAGIVVDRTAEPGEQIMIQLFKDTRQHRRFMEIFLLMLVATGLGSLGIISLTVWVTIKRGAEPINELGSRIEAIRDDDLAVRLDEGAALRELAPIVHKFNLFLDRLEESFSRERGFTSDAAHELRTPLAGLKSTIEVALARKRQGPEYRETLESALEIVQQLENLVKSLLALARLESGQERARKSEVRIENCIRDVWGPYIRAAASKKIQTSLNMNNGRILSIDRNLLVQVLEELFRNAVYYVDPGGSVRIDLFQDGGMTKLAVSNTGSKVSAEETGRVFDRFWRGGHFGEDTGVRFGLGLPIVSKIVETLGMQMEVRSELDGEFVVTLVMPGESVAETA